MEGRDEMIKASISLQDLRRRIYLKAKAEKSWRFWGLYVHVCKRETLHEAYVLAKANDGAPGIDGVTFKAIEESGLERFLEQIRDELRAHTYLPMRNRKKEIPKSNGKVRTLSIPSIRDRVVQGALKLILEPIFEADFQPGSFGYRPKRSAHQAVRHVETAIMLHKWRVIDLDLRAFFDNVSHSILLAKVAARVNDPDVMHLLKLILRASGKKGVPQGGVISPVMSNLYLNEVDRMLERAKEVTRHGAYTDVEYVRYADDLAILVYGGKRAQWLLPAIYRRVREELAKLRVEINEEKSRIVNMSEGDTIGFLGFDFRYVRSRNGKWTSHTTPQRKKRTALLERLRREFDRFRSQPVEDVVAEINPILRGWVNYFAIGNSARCFSYVRNWVEVRIRRHVQRARKQRGFGWKTWTRERLTRQFGLFTEYRVRHRRPSMGAAPAQ